MVQNVNQTNGDIPTDTDADATIRVIFHFSEETDPCFDRSSFLVLDHQVGMVETAPLTEANGISTLTLILEAGDVAPIKYRTGGPFSGDAP